MLYIALGIAILLAIGLIFRGIKMMPKPPRTKGGLVISERDEMKLWGKND